LIPPQEWLAAFHYPLTAFLSPTFGKAVSRPAARESTAGKPLFPSGFGFRALVVMVRYDINTFLLIANQLFNELPPPLVF